MRAIIFSVVTAGFALGGWAHAECRVGEFQTKSSDQLSLSQYLSVLSTMSKEDWEQKGKAMAASGSYGVISGSASYSQMQSDVHRMMSLMSSTSSTDYSHAQATTSLDSTGLAAYLHCVGGLTVELGALSGSSGKLIVNWDPAPGETIPQPQVLSSSNISNISEVQTALAQAGWGGTPASKEITIRKAKPQDSADITIGAGAISKVAYLPPPAPRTKSETWTVDARTCSSNGNNDHEECEVFSQDWRPAANAELIVAYSVNNLTITKSNRCAEPNDPHRRGHLRLQCGGVSDRDPYLGENNVSAATVVHNSRISCDATQGQQVRISLIATPRGCSDMAFDGTDTVSLVEIDR